MKITFCGVRGSTPAPGAEFVRYGGNTACVHVELDDGTDIVLDAGTGIRELGKRLAAKKTPVHILLSHNHWDHIQGFPFFIPIYQPNREILITPGLTDLKEPEAVLDQMTGSYFPVHKNDLGASIQVIPRPVLEDDEWYISNGLVSRLKMNHPGGGSCYTNCILPIENKPTSWTLWHLQKVLTFSFMMRNIWFLTCRVNQAGGIALPKRP